MTERVLALQPLAPEQRAQLEQTGVEIVDATDWENQAPITIIFGWDREVGPAALMAPNNQVKWIQTVSAGIDYLPLDWIKAHDVQVTNASGVYSPAIAESTLGYLLYFVRGFNEAVKNQAGHFWQQPARDDLNMLANQHVVIYGTGSIGQAIAKLLNGFGNQPAGVNRSGHPVDGFGQTVSLDHDQDLLKDADIVINAMPATSTTVHYFDEGFFKQLDGLNVFVNVGRGKSVDQQALMNALLYQNVLHAALDVFETEPLPKDSRLWDYPNVLVTPHQTGFAKENTAPILDIFGQNLKSWLADGSLTVNLTDVALGY
ncbi:MULTISPECIES: NAD(P)-dependent oxidoreductase [Lactobacillaceae]|uniref:NAD(P)-dependent oxidoreductase n=1 Tax=Lactobacillaceae TaxID=33958 RepID=UPI001456F507|nr:NAD(P)-dependent oxidoreductase [Lactobacillus sp. HBUAS51381]NLR09037.1 phosphoglycerate dehydrogenase [Lactobacillus sp. HBUAS51381]